jgi:mannose-6-phosphate isomerase-like protein (cupin superfamily)
VCATRWTALRIEDVEAVPWRGSELVWHPLRAALGLRGFGAGAYTAARAGQELVEAHVEAGDGRAHDELYVVLTGRAEFTLDGTTVDAPAGTLVHVPAAVHRQAVAREVPATVLAFGGPPDFQPAGGEWLERARPFVRSDPARARRVLDEGARERPDSPAIPFGRALLAAVEGRAAEAGELLATALAGEPLLYDEAAADPDLAPLLDGLR